MERMLNVLDRKRVEVHAETEGGVLKDFLVELVMVD
jgi:hypothetical protein